MRKFQGRLLLLLAGLALPAWSAPLEQLQHQVPESVANLTPLGRLPASQRLSFAIGLPLRNQAALGSLLQQIYDSASPNFHHYLTPEQFTEQFGPRVQDYEAVAAFARANGLTVTTRHSNRALLDVEGSVTDIEKALHVRMNSYQHPTESRTFYAPDADPSLDLTVPLAGISGLDNFSRPRPRLVATRLTAMNHASPNSGSGLQGTYMGKDFRAAYVPTTTLTGAGQSVGLLQFDGYTASDITYYETAAGLPNVPLNNVLLDGFGGGPTGGGGEVEVSLDIEMSISMAPGLSQVIVYMAGPEGNWHDILNRMADDDLAKQLSCSWYIPNGAADPVADGIFQQMAAQGQSFYAASGDSGAYSGLIPFPGDTPYITEVGGTTLTTTGPQGSWVSETTWNWENGDSTGGGISTQYPIPSWQAPVPMTANHGSINWRNTPDVALTADNVYVRADGGNWDVGGTSCAAPLWAGFTSLMNQQAVVNGLPLVGFLNPSVYKVGLGSGYGQAFHDITTGNNGSATHFPAVTGYDLCTGWGTPNGQGLINAIIPPDTLVITPNTGFAASGAVGGPFSTNAQTFTLTNASAGTLTWSVGNPATWLSPSASGGLLAAGAVTNLTVSLDSASSNLAPGVYSANFAVTNVASNFVHLLPFSLAVHDPLVIVPTNGFNSVGPVGGPFSISSLNLSLSNSGLGSLNWSLSNNASWLDVSSSGGTLPSGTATNLTASLDPSANTLPPALYDGNLVFSNLTSGLIQSVPFSLQTGELPLQNGGFELGNFTGWTLSGNTVGMLVTSNPMFVHSGVYGAELGPEGSPGYLSQTLATAPGQVYLISFWLENEGVTGPNQFQVIWNGSTVFNEANVGMSGWTNIQILVGSTGSSSVLQFGVLNDNSSFGLDDVQVFQSSVPPSPPTITSEPTNETVTAGWTATFAAEATGIQPVYYQWQFGASNIAGATSPALVISPVTEAEAGNYTLVVSNAFGATNSSNAVLTVNTPVCDPPAAGLISWWQAEGSAVDSFGTNNGALQGGVTFTNGEVGQTFSFDGSSGNVIIPDSIGLHLTNQLTIEAWINTRTTNGDQSIVGKVGNASGFGLAGYQFNLHNNELTGQFNNVPGQAWPLYYVQTPVPIVLGTWNHVAWTYNQSAMILYFNGQPVATNLLGAQSIAATTNNLRISSDDGNNAYFNGQIDETSVYNTALSAAQILAIYNAGSAGKCDTSPPIISVQPQSQTVLAGSTVVFSVGASGNQPLSYQWFVNQSNILAATNATLVLTNVSLGLSGNLYSVLVTNLLGSTNSSNALLTVNLPPPCAPAAASLVSWWKGEDNANDSNGTNNGTLQGGVTFTNGEVGQAFNFDGSSGNVIIPDSSTLHLTNQLTIEAWINTRTTNGDQSIVGKVGSPSGIGLAGYQLDLHNNELSGDFNSAVGQAWPTYVVETPVPLVPGTWNHVAWTYNQSAMILYFNGQPVATNVIGAQSIAATANNLRIGGDDGNNSYFNGQIDEASVYNTALSAAQILAIYNAGITGKCADSPPVITAQPQSETLVEGSTAIFSVGASGNQPLSYQWFVNQSNILAATNATLVLTNVSLGLSGNLYSVLVTNPLGSTNSSNALLTVNLPPPCAPPASSLVSWWKAEGNASDSFNTNNGTLQGGVTFTNGEVGQAFNFDGSSGNVIIPDSSTLRFTNQLTIEAWINTRTTNGDQSIVGKVGSPSGIGLAGYQLDLHNNELSGDFNSVVGQAWPSYVVETPVPLVPGTWNHVAWTYNQSAMILYFNGQPVATNLLGAQSIAATANNLRIGGDDGNNSYFNGQIDEASVYNTALSAAQILAIYNAGNAGKCDSAPVITSQPQSETLVEGSTVVFSVGASGSQPLSYQWFVNQASLPMATNATLVLTNVQLGLSGNLYSVLVTNLLGSTNSASAMLTVNPPPPCAPPAASLVSWWKGEDNASDSAGTNNGTLQGGVTFANGEVGQAFNFDGSSGTVVVPDSSSLRFTSQLTIEAWINTRTTNGDQSIVAKINNPGSGLTGYQFNLHNNELTGQFNSFSGQAWPAYYVQTPVAIVPGTWNHVAWTYNQSAMILYFNGQPVTTNLLGAEPVGSSAGALWISGSVNVVYFNGLIDEASVYNTALSAAQIQAIYAAGGGGKCLPAIPPTITAQPTNQAVPLGATAMFSVGATSTLPLTYQWQFDQSNILAALNPTATNATLVLSNVQPASAGDYSVVVTNLLGSTNSSNAVLTILYPPTITLRPHSQLVQLGCSVVFNSAATGSGTLTYQWQRNGANLPGENGTNLAVLDIQSSDFGDYTMIASNAYGAATSSVALLALDELPVPGGVIVQRYPGGGIRFNTSSILAAASSPDGDPLSLIEVNTNSVAGGAVTWSGASIYYLPPAGFTNADAFDYTISDGNCGGTAVGTVLVEVRTDMNPASRVMITEAGNGSVQVIFDGMPGVDYQIQSTGSLMPPDWQDVTNLTADQYGTYMYVDWPATNGPVRFFRSASP